MRPRPGGRARPQEVATRPTRRRPPRRTCSPRLRRRASDQRWVADITEFPTGDGKLYLAGIRDLCHRGLVGWSMGERRTTDLVVDAARHGARGAARRPTARASRRPRGQYTSLEFSNRRRHRRPADQSTDRPATATTTPRWRPSGRPSKERSPDPRRIWFQTRAELHDLLFDYIEVFYNRRRHQSPPRPPHPRRVRRHLTA